MAQPALTLESPGKDEVLSRGLIRAARLLGLRNLDVARMIGTSAASVSRMTRGRALDHQSKEGELALLFLRLFRSLDALVGGDADKAKAWLHSENEHLGGVPAERILTVQGLVDTTSYLDALRGRN